MSIPAIADAAGVYVSGAFVALACTGDVTEIDTSEGIEFVTDEGSRMVMRGPTVAKSWAVSSRVPRSWAESADYVRAGLYGHGPWWFYNPRAWQTNALRNGFTGDTSGYATVEGVLVPLVVSSQGVVGKLASGRAVVKAGVTVTGSVVVSGACSAALNFYDGNGVFMSRVVASNVTGTVRLAMTATVPQGAVTAAVSVEQSSTTTLYSAGWPQIIEGTAPGTLAAPSGMGLVDLTWGERAWSRLGGVDGDELVQVDFTAKEVGVNG